MRVKIYGAGSIGNHLAHASRALGWEVSVCDVSARALERMRKEIYPSRYGRWDDQIKLYSNEAAPSDGFDLIMIGTPPDFHIPLALKSLDENPQGLLIEKPLGPPSLPRGNELWRRANASATRVFVGYTHVVGQAARKAEELLASNLLGDVQTLDVAFREHWEGIFKAHPWLKGPEDSYLGYWEAGGGASGEHSHAVNLWQHFAHVLRMGRVKEVSAQLSYVREGKAWYDRLCFATLKTEVGLLGRVVQDVVTRPARKFARIQGSKGAVEWVANYNAEGDAVLLVRPGRANDVFLFPKKRPDDFIDELKHVAAHLSANSSDSPIRLERGFDTMFIIAAAHLSQKEQRTVQIDDITDLIDADEEAKEGIRV